MLDGGTHPVALHPVYHGGAHLAGQQRIFRVVLEVAAIERVALNVHARRQQDIHPVLPDLIPHGFPHGLDQLDVPAGGQQRADGPGGGMVGGAVVVAVGADPKARRAVGQLQGRDVDAVGTAAHPVDVTRHPGDILLDVDGAVGAAITGAGEQIQLLGQGQPGHHGFGLSTVIGVILDDGGVGVVLVATHQDPGQGQADGK
ncbi:hypothetical protein D3C80_1165960 [compost metagenome]